MTLQFNHYFVAVSRCHWYSEKGRYLFILFTGSSWTQNAVGILQLSGSIESIQYLKLNNDKKIFMQ